MPYSARIPGFFPLSCRVCLNGAMATLGVDLGGTAVKVGVLGNGSRVLARAEVPTRPKEGASAVVDRIAETLATFRPVSALGVGAAGPLNAARSVILEAPNLHWKRVPRRARRSQRS